MVRLLFCFLMSGGVAMGLNMKAQIVADIINSYEKPTAAVAKVCWEISAKLHLVGKLMNIDNAKTIQFIDEYKSIEKYKAEDMLIVLDFNCPDKDQFLEQAEINKKFLHPYRWMLLFTKETIDIILPQLGNLSILVDSDVIIVHKMKDGQILLNTVYKIDSRSNFNIESFGTWTLEKRLNLSEETNITKAMRRKNLKGKVIVASSVSSDERTKTQIYNINVFVKDDLTKATYHNILPLYEFMNATVKLIFTDTWGFYINNSWNGMIGQLMRGEADLCGTLLLLSPLRVNTVNYLTQPIPTTATFVFRDPPLSLQNNLFILPFKPTVWMCTGALTVVLTFIIYVNAMWEDKKSDVEHDNPTVLRPYMSDILIYVASAVVQQGSNYELKGCLGRVVTFIMFLIFLFLYTSYSANIVALLQSSSDQIRTLPDLLNSKFELGVEDQPYNRYYFPMATDSVRKAIYDTKIAKTGYKPNFMSLEEGVKKLQNLGYPFAFHMNMGMGYRLVEEYFYEHEKCGLREIRYIPDGYPWMCCRKQSPYKEISKIGFIRTMEHGIADRINQLVYARKPTCTTRGGSFASVTMTDFHPVLLCLLYGMVASVFVLGLEIIVFYRQQRRMNINDISVKFKC